MNMNKNNHIEKIISERSRNEIRESYLVFPKITQPFWTLLTGKPLNSERPIIGLNPISLFSYGFFIFIFICFLAFVTFHLNGGINFFIKILIAPYFSLYFTGYYRKIQVMYCHHAIHGNLFKSRSMNILFSKIFTIFTLSQNEIDYSSDHLKHHNKKIFTTIEDTDASLLQKLKIKPNIAKKKLKMTLLKNILSFRFHIYFFTERVKSNFKRKDCRLILCLWITILILSPLIFGIYFSIIVLWLPLTFLYQASALLQFSTEHMWLIGKAPDRNLKKYAKRCIGRFCGEPTPVNNTNKLYYLPWVLWWLKLLLIHIPTRLSIIVGDLPAHDWHHLAPHLMHSPNNWCIAIYERQRAIKEGDKLNLANRECWGIFSMIDYVFSRMSKNN